MVQNELHACDTDRSAWRFVDLKHENVRTELFEKVQTTQGVVERLVAINGMPLDAQQRAAEDARLQKLANDPDEQRRRLKEQLEDAGKARRMFEMLPTAFLYEFNPATKDSQVVRVTFKPNPQFQPPTREAEVFHHMTGELLINTQQLRLRRIAGTLLDDVKFGWGVLGHLDKGGTFTVEQEEVGTGHWDVVALDVSMRGKIVFFKSLNVQQHEAMSHFEHVPESLSVADATRLLGTSNVVAAK